MKFTEHDESLDFTAIVDDDIDGDSTEEDSEGITRTSFYENFYFQLNPKDTAQNKLKKFLSFIPAYEYTETGEKVPVQTIIGTQAYVDMNIVMDNVQDILVGTKPNEEAILDKLERAAKAIDKFKDTKKAWLQDLIDYYKKSPKDLRKQFISQMTRHKIRMSFVNVNSYYDKNGKLVYSVNLMEDNSGDLSYKILRQWKDNLKESALISSGVVNGDVLDRIKTQFENLQKRVESNLSVV
jgi:hypothetical protein